MCVEESVQCEGVHVFRCVFTCVRMHMEGEIRRGTFLSGFFASFLSHSLTLNLELTSWLDSSKSSVWRSGACCHPGFSHGCWV